MKLTLRRWSILSAFLVSLITLSSVAPAFAQDATPAASPVAEGSPVAQVDSDNHGVDPANFDTAVSPGDNFYRYATGGWQDRTEIPGDEGSYGSANIVNDLTIEQLLGLLDELSKSTDVPVGSDEWKAVQLFRQATDLTTRNAQGVSAIQDDLDAIDAIASLDDLYDFQIIAGLNTHLWGFFGIFGSSDLADSSMTTAWYSGPGLGLPNRDYYWVDDENNETIRAAYKEAMAKLLSYLGYDDAQATVASDAVYAFEKAQAEPILRPEDFNDPGNYYNPMPIADVIAANPSFDWPAYLAFMGIADQPTIVVTEVAYLNAIEDILAATDIETIKDFLKLQTMWYSASFLTVEIEDIAFDFGSTFSGVTEQSPLDERALSAVNGALGFALGKLYVDEYFPPEAKVQIEELVARLVAATKLRVEALEWMSPETKKTAIAKLDSLRVKVGYPDVWRTYENVNIEESYAETMLSANIAEYRRTLAQIGRPVDRDEWGMLPQEVNAYYNPGNNEIVFPAGILQAPYFDYQADLASNYGAIGAIIGHEITHGFDQSGSQFDADGNFTDWWTPEDKTRFEELTGAVVTQYDAIEVIPGLMVDGGLTIGENIADMGGLQIAYDALQIALDESGDPGVIDGLTQNQRFFLSFAFSWAEKSRDEYLNTLVRTNEHAPAQVRGAQPERNMDAFYEAFGIEAGDPVYLAPEERIVIW